MKFTKIFEFQIPEIFTTLKDRNLNKSLNSVSDRSFSLTIPSQQLCIPRNRQAHALTGVGRIHQAGFA